MVDLVLGYLCGTGLAFDGSTLVYGLTTPAANRGDSVLCGPRRHIGLGEGDSVARTAGERGLGVR